MLAAIPLAPDGKLVSSFSRENAETLRPSNYHISLLQMGQPRPGKVVDAP